MAAALEIDSKPPPSWGRRWLDRAWPRSRARSLVGCASSTMSILSHLSGP